MTRGRVDPVCSTTNDFAFFNASEECRVVSLDALPDIVEACWTPDGVGYITVRPEDEEDEEDEGLEEEGYKGDRLPLRLRLEGVRGVSMDYTSENVYVLCLIALPDANTCNRPMILETVHV